MASLIIEHGTIPRYLPKKVTNYKYTERSNSQTVNYVYSANSSVIWTKGWGIDETITDNAIKIETLCNIMGNVSTEAQEGGGMIAIGSLQTYYPYRPHEEIYHNNCVPYYEDGVQVGWQETAETVRTSIVVMDDWNWTGDPTSENVIYDRDTNRFYIEMAIKGVIESGASCYHTTINDDIQYVGRMGVDPNFVVNRTIYDVDGNQIGRALPDPYQDMERKKERTLYFNGVTDPEEIEERKGQIRQIFNERQTSVTISTSPTAQAITSTDSGMVWALTGANKWSTRMSEQAPFDDGFPSYLPLILVPYTGTEDVKLYSLQLTEEIEP